MNGAPPDVSILMVSYRTRELVLRCLDSIAAMTTRVSYEVVLVDNASGDGTVDAVGGAHPDVVVTALEENIGFARAVNKAAELARGRHLLLLNPDTVLVTDAVSALADFADSNPTHGVYGGRTLSPDGTPDPRSCFGAPSLWSHCCFGLGFSAIARGRT